MTCVAVQVGLCNAIKYFLNKIGQKKINNLCRENKFKRNLPKRGLLH